LDIHEVDREVITERRFVRYITVQFAKLSRNAGKVIAEDRRADQQRAMLVGFSVFCSESLQLPVKPLPTVRAPEDQRLALLRFERLAAGEAWRFRG
jgi:hypothetical protein